MLLPRRAHLGRPERRRRGARQSGRSGDFGRDSVGNARKDGAFLSVVSKESRVTDPESNSPTVPSAVVPLTAGALPTKCFAAPMPVSTKESDLGRTHRGSEVGELPGTDVVHAHRRRMSISVAVLRHHLKHALFATELFQVAA